MFHTTFERFDAAVNILREHYKSTKCEVSFYKLAQARYLGEVEIFFMYVSNFFLLTTVQKLHSRLHLYCHFL